MFPTERRDVFELVIRDSPIRHAQVRGCAVKIDGVPMDDGADDEIETGSAECLALEDRSRISPRSWKNTARLSLCAASPLLRPAWHRRRKAGLEYHSIMNSDRSIRPSSRSALANWLSFGEAESFSGSSRGRRRAS